MSRKKIGKSRRDEKWFGCCCIRTTFLLVVFSIGQPSRAAPRLGVVVSRARDEQDGLLDVIQFRSQREKLCFAGDLAWMLGIESNAREIVSSRCSPIFGCKSDWITSSSARKPKWMYNGRVRGSLWYTISARSTCLGR